jgi:hypothetical protein
MSCYKEALPARTDVLFFLSAAWLAGRKLSTIQEPCLGPVPTARLS